MTTSKVGLVDNMRYNRVGDGPVSVILLPGLGSGDWIYDDLASRLAATATVVRVLVSGMAGSGYRPGPVLPRAVKALRTIIEQQPGPVVIIAHSLGGAIAMSIMADAPENLVGFVALDAGPRPYDPAELSQLHKEIDDLALELFPEKGFTKVGGGLDEWIRQMASNKPDQDRLIRDFRSSPTELLREVFSEGRKQQLSLSNSRFVTPALVLVACELENEREEYRADFAARYVSAEDVTIITIAASRHYVMLDQPGATALAISHFLARFD